MIMSSKVSVTEYLPIFVLNQNLRISEFEGVLGFVTEWQLELLLAVSYYLPDPQLAYTSVSVFQQNVRNSPQYKKDIHFKLNFLCICELFQSK